MLIRPKYRPDGDGGGGNAGGGEGGDNGGTGDNAGAAGEGQQNDAQAQAEKTFTQRDVDRIISQRFGKLGSGGDVDEIVRKAREYDAIQEAGKTETELVAEQRDGLQTKVASLEPENLRLRVALEKKLPAELVDRLRGGSREELESDADALLKMFRAGEGGDGELDFDGGPRGRSAAGRGGMDGLIRQQAGRG